MSPDRLSPSANPSDPGEEEEFEEEDEEFEDEEEDGDEQVAADDEDEEDEAEEEEESLEKTASPVRGLDYGSDADSGKTSPSPSDYMVKENLEGKKKKRAAESEAVNENDKSKLKKSKKEKKKGVKENFVVSASAAAAAEGNVVAEDKAKRLSGQRIWGPEDELMIVKGMLDYKEKTGIDFNSNLDAFYQFIKVQLNAVVDKTQLVNKIRKLKEKFRDSVAKVGNGGELLFVKIHEAEVYEYSKKVWGGNVVARSKSKSKKEREVVVDVPQHVMEVDNVLALPVSDLELSKKEVNGGGSKSASRVQNAVKKPNLVHKSEFVQADVEMKDFIIPMPPMVDGIGLELIEKSKVDALNEKWTKYQMDAAELYVRRLDLIKEQTELVLDAMKSNT